MTEPTREEFHKEESLLATTVRELSKPGQWPPDTTMVAFYDADLNAVGGEATLKTPDHIRIQAPDDAEYAVAYTHNTNCDLALLVSRDGSRHTLLLERGKEEAEYRFGAAGRLIDTIFGEFAYVFEELL